MSTCAVVLLLHTSEIESCRPVRRSTCNRSTAASPCPYFSQACQFASQSILCNMLHTATISQSQQCKPKLWLEEIESVTHPLQAIQTVSDCSKGMSSLNIPSICIPSSRKMTKYVFDLPRVFKFQSSDFNFLVNMTEDEYDPRFWCAADRHACRLTAAYSPLRTRIASGKKSARRGFKLRRQMKKVRLFRVGLFSSIGSIKPLNHHE